MKQTATNNSMFKEYPQIELGLSLNCSKSENPSQCFSGKRWICASTPSFVFITLFPFKTTTPNHFYTP
jgi:hypothetical protein